MKNNVIQSCQFIYTPVRLAAYTSTALLQLIFFHHLYHTLGVLRVKHQLPCINVPTKTIPRLIFQG